LIEEEGRKLMIRRDGVPEETPGVRRQSDEVEVVSHWGSVTGLSEQLFFKQQSRKTLLAAPNSVARVRGAGLVGEFRQEALRANTVEATQGPETERKLVVDPAVEPIVEEAARKWWGSGLDVCLELPLDDDDVPHTIRVGHENGSIWLAELGKSDLLMEFGLADHERETIVMPP
jgi:hypothetical protein